MLDYRWDMIRVLKEEKEEEEDIVVIAERNLGAGGKWVYIFERIDLESNDDDLLVGVEERKARKRIRL